MGNGRSIFDWCSCCANKNHSIGQYRYWCLVLGVHYIYHCFSVDLKHCRFSQTLGLGCTSDKYARIKSLTLTNNIQSRLANYAPDSAASYGLANCSGCHKLSPVTDRRCDRCGAKLKLRTANSVQTTLALVVTALLCYIPANLLPIMTTTSLGNATNSTIIGGVVLFLEHGSYFIAFVIFTASVIIPMAKIGAILWLCIALYCRQKLNPQELTRMYRIIEFIGKWSMIDVFVVAILVALVQLQGLMSIQPGIAISAFTVVVILTMVAAHQFDVRLIWDRLEK